MDDARPQLAWCREGAIVCSVPGGTGLTMRAGCCPESRASQQDHSLAEAPISALTRRGSLPGGSYAMMMLLLCYDIVCMEEEE